MGKGSIVAIAILFGLSCLAACSRKGSSGPAPTPTGDGAIGEGNLGAMLDGAGSVEGKWDVLVGHFARRGPTFVQEPDLRIEDQVRRLIVKGYVESEFYLEHYPEVRWRLLWQEADLEELAAQLSDRRRILVEGAPDSKLVRGEMARRWLLLLTGEDFSDLAAFARWRGKATCPVRWNSNVGRFEMCTGCATVQDSK